MLGHKVVMFHVLRDTGAACPSGLGWKALGYQARVGGARGHPRIELLAVTIPTFWEPGGRVPSCPSQSLEPTVAAG